MLEVLFSGSWVQSLLFGLTVAFLIYFIAQKYRFKVVPGPFALPFFGNIIQLYGVERVYEKFYEWSKTYGPIVSVQLGPVKFIVLNDIDSAMEMLVKKTTEFAGRPTSPSMELVTDNCKDIAFGQYGPTWKLHRKNVTRALRNYMQGTELETRIHSALELTTEKLESELGKPTSPHNYLALCVMNILTGVCYGGRYEFDDPDLIKFIEADDDFTAAFNSGIVLEDVIPGLKHVYKSALYREIEDLYRELVPNFTAKRFYEEKKTYDPSNIRHLTDMMLSAREEAVKEDGPIINELLTDQHLIQASTDIFLNGIDTIRITVGFAILHMMMFPDIQDKVQEEIDREVGPNRLPGLDDRNNLSYTEAVLHESMRLAPATPTTVFHMALCDAELGGYRIPKGTPLTVNIWALHHNPDLWEDVERFIPERFLDENGKLGPKPLNWLPFSAGKRVCVGEFVAKPYLHLVFAGLMQRFKWRFQSGVTPDPSLGGTMTFATPKPYKAIITKR